MNDEARELLAHCEQRGVDWARVHIAGLGNSDAAIAGRHWIAEQDRNARLANDAQQAALAQAALDAAKASKDAAQWTMIAAFIAAAGVVVSIFKP